MVCIICQQTCESNHFSEDYKKFLQQKTKVDVSRNVIRKNIHEKFKGKPKQKNEALQL